MKVPKTTSTLLAFFLLLFAEAFAQEVIDHPSGITESPLLKYRNFERGTADVVHCVAYSPDGNIIASGGENGGTIILRRASTGEFYDSLDEDHGELRSIAFSPPSRTMSSWIASGGDKGTGILDVKGKVVFWKQQENLTWTHQQNLEIPVRGNFITKPFNNNILSVAFNHEGTLMACGTSGDDVFVSEYKRQEWADPKRLEKHKHDVNSVAFLPNSNSSILASASTDGTVCLWDLSDLSQITCIQTLEGHTEAVNTIAFSPDGKFLASGGNDDKVILWKKDEGEYNYSRLYTFDGLHTNDVRSVAFTPRPGALLVSADDDGVIGISYPNSEDSEAVVPTYSSLPMPFATFSIRSIAFNALTDSHMALVVGGASGAFNISDINIWDSGAVRQFVFDTPVGADSSVRLEKPENLVSQVAFGENTNYGPATYFIFNAQFPKLIGVEDADGIYEECLITLGIDGVPEEQVDEGGIRALLRNLNFKDIFGVDLGDLIGRDLSEAENMSLDEPLYFRISLKTPRERLAELEEKRPDLLNDTIDFGLSFIKKVGTTSRILRIMDRFTTFFSLSKTTVLASPHVRVAALVARFIGNEITLFQWTRAEADAILADTANPILFLSSDADKPGLPKLEDRYLFMIQKPLTELRNIKLSMKLKFRYKSEERNGQTYIVHYEGILNLEDELNEEIKDADNNAQAAPSARPIALADYPPFKELPPEVQEYLLRYFGEFVSMTDATDWQIPEQTSLLPNYPNPFNPETWIPYQLAEPADVTLTIYDIQGRVVRDLDLGHQRPGMYHGRTRAAHWDGRNTQGEPAASGVYFYTLKAGEFTATRKMLIRK